MKYVGKLFGQIGRTRGYFDTGKTSGDWDALEARAERAEAELGKLQELHGCSQEMVLHWCEHAANRSLGLDQARSELATEREKSERYRLATLKLDAELATERARLDWVFRNCKVTADDYTTGNRDVYAIHDREDLGAAMKGDAK